MSFLAQELKTVVNKQLMAITHLTKKLKVQKRKMLMNQYLVREHKELYQNLEITEYLIENIDLNHCHLFNFEFNSSPEQNHMHSIFKKFI